VEREDDSDWIKCCTVIEVDSIGQRGCWTEGVLDRGGIGQRGCEARHSGMVIERILRDMDCPKRMHRTGANVEQPANQGHLENGI